MQALKITSIAAVVTTMAAAGVVPLSVVQAQDPLCKQLVTAILKQVTVPFHSYSTVIASYTANKPKQVEILSTGAVMYVTNGGQWQRSPETPQQEAATMRQNASNLQYYRCRKVGTEVVEGVSAAHYHIDVTDPDTPSKSELWVGANGLPVKTETDINVGGGPGGHSQSTTRYEYANIHAPAVK